MTNTISGIILLILIVLLQIFLSRNKNKFLGLILPGITVLYSLLAVFGFIVYDNLYDNQSLLSIILECVMIFIMCNIPTYILLAIYFACRNKLNKNNEIDKMNIKDL